VAFREVIEAVLKVKDANRFKAGMDKAARSVRKLGHDEEEAAAQGELLKEINKKLERQSIELTAAVTLLAHSIDELGDEMLQTAAKGEVMTKVINKASGASTPFFRRWSFWKDRLSLTRSEIMTTALTIGTYFAPAIVALGSSFAYAAIGGGAVAGAGLATFITGMVSLALVIQPAINNIKKIQKAQDMYNQTVSQYGAASVEASRQSAHLYAVIEQNGGKPVYEAQQRIMKLRQEWTKMSSSGRAVFFRGLVDGLKALKTLMPMFASNAHQMMVGLRSALAPFWQILQSNQIRQTFRSMSETFDRAIGPGVKGAVNIFVVFSRVVRASLPWVERVAKAWERTTWSWRKGTGDQKRLSSWINKGVENFKAWWGLAKQLGRTVKIIFGSSKDEGLKAVNVITNLVTKFNDWLQNMKDTGVIDRFWKKYNNSVNDAVWAVQHPVEAVNKWLPRVMDAIATTMATHAPAMAGVFIQAFLNSGSWAQLLTVAWFLKKFGFFSAVGEQVGAIFVKPFLKAFIERFAVGTIISSAAEGGAANTIGGAMSKSGGAAGAAFGRTFRVAALAAMLYAGYQFNQWLTKQDWYKRTIQQADEKAHGGGKVGTFLKGATPGNPLQTLKSIWSATKDMSDVVGQAMQHLAPDPTKLRPRGGATGGVIPPGGQSIVGEAGPEMAIAAPRGTQIVPLSRNSRHTLPGQIDVPNLSDAMRVTVYSYISVDRREIARAVSQQAAYDASRRGGRPSNG
jgi:hypothetical protein